MDGLGSGVGVGAAGGAVGAGVAFEVGGSARGVGGAKLVVGDRHDPGQGLGVGVGQGRGLAPFDSGVRVAEHAGGFRGLLLGETGCGAEAFQGGRGAFDRLEQSGRLDAQRAGEGRHGLDPGHLAAGLPLTDRADVHAGRLGQGTPGQARRLARCAQALRVEAGCPLPATGHVSSRPSQISSGDRDVVTVSAGQGCPTPTAGTLPQ